MRGMRKIDLFHLNLPMYIDGNVRLYLILDMYIYMCDQYNGLQYPFGT